MLKNFIFTLLGISLFSLPLLGQMERFQFAPKGWQGFVLKPEIEFWGGVSIPRGKFAKLSDVAGEMGAAALGYFGEIRIVQRSAAHPLWNMHLSVGYMYHPIQENAILQNYAVNVFRVDDWSIGYLMPGVAFRGGRRLKFELQISAGLLLYNGWNARRGVLDKLQNLQVYTWDFKQSIGGALRFGGQMGYKINKRWVIFANASIYFGSGRREGMRHNETFRVDTTTLTAIEPPLSHAEEVVRNKVIFSMIHLGVGVRYVLFKHLHDPNDRYKNYY